MNGKAINNIKMISKFDTIYESNFTRFQGGGFLTGDIIKLKDGWESDEWCKSAPAQVVDQIKKLAGSDLVLRVSSVKPLRPAVNSSIDQALGVDDFYIDITQELAPGRFSGEFVTVPQQLIELSGPTDSVNLADVPDSMKREDSVDVKPKELQDEDTSSQDSDMMTDPTKQTGTDDRVNKSLADTNTTLPGATGAKSYTANYM